MDVFFKGRSENVRIFKSLTEPESHRARAGRKIFHREAPLQPGSLIPEQQKIFQPRMLRMGMNSLSV